MKKIKAVMDFVQLTGPTKVIFCRRVIENMTGNTFFPTPDVSLTEASAAVDALEAAILAAASGDHAATAAMKSQIEITDNIFRTLVNYVNRIADGNEFEILGSGFHESNPTVFTPKAVLAAIDGTHNGSVKLIAKAVEKAGSYVWQSAKDLLPETDAGWTTAGISTQANYEVTGLIIASKYYFRMAAVTPDSMSDYCAPVMKVVS